MDDVSQRTLDLWDTLLPAELRLLRTLRDTALRRIRRAPAVEETSDDCRGARANAARPAA
jgi:hypothetical protein